jgi:outer membrane receptor protein involved in Fe transport
MAPSARLSIQTAYTYTNSDSRTPRIGADFFKMPGVSEHTFSLTATQRITKRLNVAFDLFAAGDYSLSPFGAQGRRLVFDGPVKADVVCGYDLLLIEGKSVELYGKVENVFDNNYYEDGFGAPGAWAIGGLRFKF